MLNAILFDIDGTLANTDPLHCQIWCELLADHGLTVDEAFYKTHISGRLNEQIVADLLPHLSAEEGRRFSDHKEALFRDRAQMLTPMPGLLDLLHWLDEQGLKRAVVTNAPTENAWFMLRSLQLEHRFPEVVLAADLPRGKPDPLPYQVALQRLGVLAEEALVFEDSPSGIRSAVGAGIATIGIASTHAPEHLSALGTTLVIPDFTDLRLEALLRSRLTSPSPRTR